MYPRLPKIFAASRPKYPIFFGMENRTKSPDFEFSLIFFSKNQKNANEERVNELEVEVQELKEKLEGVEDMISENKRLYEPRSVNKFSSYQRQMESQANKTAEFE